jgi:ATP-binding cassette subfamily F protein 3
LENITEACPKVVEQKIRAFAGSFLFTKDSILKKVGVLSGGEKNRVGMIKVLLQNANLLLLDEPTNHLDIQSKDILLTALQSYQGTILFVSHDQDFVNKLATDIVELSVDGAKEYQGNYELYLYQKQQETSSSAKATVDKQDGASKKVNNKKQSDLSSVALAKEEVKALERKVQKLEHDIQRTENSFADLVFGTPKFADAQKKLTDLKKELEGALAEWENSQS